MATYDECVDAWERSRLAMGDVSEHTASKSAKDARRLSPFIGEDQVDSITASDIENAIVSLRESGNVRKKGVGLSNTTLRKTHKAGKAAIGWAIDHDMAVMNPFERAARPKGASHEVTALDSGDAAKLMDAVTVELDSCMLGRITRSKAKDAAGCIAVMVALGAGMRCGEITGLDWHCVSDGAITVRQSEKADSSLGAPKTKAGIRRISIAPMLSAVLVAYRRWQEMLFSIKPDECSPVLANLDGSRVTRNALEHWWMEYRRCIGFDGLNFHALRHTHATLLIAGGVDIKTVQTRMGHSSAVMTLDVYSHAVPRNDELAANEIGDVLYGKGRR